MVRTHTTRQLLRRINPAPLESAQNASQFSKGRAVSFANQWKNRRRFRNDRYTTRICTIPH